jgi:hypothetical protein
MPKGCQTIALARQTRPHARQPAARPARASRSSRGRPPSCHTREGGVTGAGAVRVGTRAALKTCTRVSARIRSACARTRQREVLAERQEPGAVSPRSADTHAAGTRLRVRSSRDAAPLSKARAAAPQRGSAASCLSRKARRMRDASGHVAPASPPAARAPASPHRARGILVSVVFLSASSHHRSVRSRPILRCAAPRRAQHHPLTAPRCRRSGCTCAPPP